MAFVNASPFLHRRATRRICVDAPVRCRRRTHCSSSSASSTRTTVAASATASAGAKPDPFGTDGGRDLFFTGMDEALAREILTRPRAELSSPDDRYIAAERLKYFRTASATRALLDFLSSEDGDPLALPVEERAARRKAVETLGRHAGAHHVGEVRAQLRRLLQDADIAAVENAVWALGQLPGALEASDSASLQALLDVSGAPHRAALHTLTQKQAADALPAVMRYVPPCSATASAAAAARSVLGGDDAAMPAVVRMLADADLNVRRAAIYDIGAASYRPALDAVVRAPLSLVLRLNAAHQVLADADAGGKSASAAPPTNDEIALLCRLVWDHPGELDLSTAAPRLTARQRAVARNVRALGRNDARDAYVAVRVLAEDACADAGKQVLAAYTERGYFDYFASYHIFKALGWLRYAPARNELLHAATELPPRYYNHRVGALTALANMHVFESADGDVEQALDKAARDPLWQVRLAACVCAQHVRLPDVFGLLVDDDDVVVRAVARTDLHAAHVHLSDSFVYQ